MEQLTTSTDLAVSYDDYEDIYDLYNYNYGYGNTGYGSGNISYGYSGTYPANYTNDGFTVTVYGDDNCTVDLSSTYYGAAININATYSMGVNRLIGNYAANTIWAGSSPTSLWGGTDYANDVLVGGWSSDTFFCGKYDGNDVVVNASAYDTVSLYNVNVFDIAAYNYDGTNLAFLFNTGTTLLVGCTDYVSPTFTTADGGVYTFNRVTCSWQ